MVGLAASIALIVASALGSTPARGLDRMLAVSSPEDAARAVAIQAGGKIVAAGESFDGARYVFAVARYNAQGRLDPSFGTDGKRLTDLGSPRGLALPRAVAVQTDRRIVVAGEAFAGGAAGSFDFGLVRYDARGRLDPTFGRQGRVLSDLGQLRDDGVEALAIQADRKIVAAGRSAVADISDFALVRYRVDGRPDPSFGRDGEVFTDLASSGDDRVEAIAIQADGKIVAAGSRIADGDGDFALARYNADGTLDRSFGSGGVVLTSLGSSSHEGAFAVRIQADQKIVAAGSRVAGGDRDFALVRYNADGSIDPGFGSGGSVVSDLGSSQDFLEDIAILRDGSIVAVGSSLREGGDFDFAVARFDGEGRVDEGFGLNGRTLTDLGSASADSASAVGIQAGEKIVAAGSRISGVDRDFALVRYDAQGSIDSRFGEDGKVITDFAPGTRVVSFRATRVRAGLLVRWRTLSEVDSRGFNVYREQSGRRVRTNASVIRNRGNARRGRSYSFLDRRARGTRVRYWLQELRTGRGAGWYGPVAVRR
jgi:uncharacterized delta-60 repeat protein